MSLNRRLFLQAYLQQYGMPYLWDGKGLPGEAYNGRDCSGGVTGAVFRASGFKLDMRATWGTKRLGADLRQVAVKDALPGDLFLYGDPIHHVMVGIYGNELGGWLVAGFAGGDETTLTLERANVQGGKFQFWFEHTHMKHFQGVRRIPWMDEE
jgi:hypothetical protein